MKKLKYFCSAILVFALMAIPAAAQKSHNNKGGINRGDARVDLVQPENKSKDKDKDKDPAPDNDKNKGKHKGETQGKHKAKGHSH